MTSSDILLVSVITTVVIALSVAFFLFQRQSKSVSSTGRPESLMLRKLQTVPKNHLHIGSVGLCNLGNSCYQSAVIQVMFSVPLFHEYFLTLRSRIKSGQKRLRVPPQRPAKAAVASGDAADEDPVAAQPDESVENSAADEHQQKATSGSKMKRKERDRQRAAEHAKTVLTVERDQMNFEAGTAAALAATPDEGTSLAEAVGVLVEAYSHVANQHPKGAAASTPPLRADAIRACMGRVDDAFLVGQQDAAEFMVNWLVQLADSLNRVVPPPAQPPQQGRRHPSVEALESEFHRESSFLDEVLKSQLEASYVCLNCQKKSCIYEHPLNVDLNIRQGSGGKARLQTNHTVSLSVLLSEFCGTTEKSKNGKDGAANKKASRDPIFKYCEQCSPAENVQHVKSVQWTSLPPVLIFVLKRYSPLSVGQDPDSAEKIHARVDFPLDNLDMRPFCCASGGSSDGIGEQYRLVGVVDHIGQTLDSGHYTSTCARYSPHAEAQSNGHGPATASWVRFDDRSVQNASRDRVVTCSSYVLVYQSLAYIGASKSDQPKPDIAGICSDDEC